MSTFHTLKVSKAVQETPDATTIYFDIPDSLKGDFAFKPGQYLTLKFSINGEDVRRAYSICTSTDEEQIGVNVKRVKGGLVSNHVNDHVKAGAEVEVMTPDGNFYLQPNEAFARDFYLIAAGSGITPMMSIIKTMLEHEPKSRCYLLYGNRDEDNIIFDDELKTLEKRYAGQLVVRHTLSKPKREKVGGLKGLFSKGKISWEGWQGRINGEKIDAFLDENPAVSSISHYCVCGPGGMIDNIIAHIEDKGIDKSFIHTEHFVSAHDIEAGEGVTSSVKVNYGGQQYAVEVPADKTILEALWAEKIEVPYSCTSGACSTCVAKVTEGETAMDACYALDDTEVKAGYILTCQARCQSEQVEITFE